MGSSTPPPLSGLGTIQALQRMQYKLFYGCTAVLQFLSRITNDEGTQKAEIVNLVKR